LFPTKIKYLVNGIIVSCPKDRRGLTKALHAAKTIQVKELKQYLLLLEVEVGSRARSYAIL